MRTRYQTAIRGPWARVALPQDHEDPRSLLLIAFVLMTGLAHAGDPTGAATGTATDVTAATAGQPTLSEAAADLGHLKIAANLFVDHLRRGADLLHAGGLRARRDRLLPGEEREPRHHDQLRHLRHRHARLLGGRLRPAVRWRRRHRGVGRCAAADGHARDRQGLGYRRPPGLLPRPAGPTTWVSWRSSSSSSCSWTPRPTIVTGAMAERWKFSAFIVFGVFMCRHHLSHLRQLGLGRRLALGLWAATSAWATGRWTSPVRVSCTPSAASRPWRAPSSSGRGSASSTRTAVRTPSPGTTFPWPSWARSSWCSVGWASTACRPSRPVTSASPSSSPTR